MDRIFQVVYKTLKWISEISGLTYHEVNIIVYYMVIPTLFIFLISKIFKAKSLLIGFIIFLLFVVFVISDFEKFATALFEGSVNFLNSFSQVGLNYVQASVVICVIIPTVILAALLYWHKKKPCN
ncbi:hypothetical protein [Cellulophaga baltica]|jgi:hypothetical protein|uniref:Uncharacterized protein n=1 Tax=Cellulophaga baltica 18 TaxID=1348584 RepID=A0AAU8RJ20_9FLAO|nr:hypothetical protein [Cellulophaga baltica]AIZ42403.1 hypothetical protein M666_12925 [Cellulophaga baltica 18]